MHETRHDYYIRYVFDSDVHLIATDTSGSKPDPSVKPIPEVKPEPGTKPEPKPDLSVAQLKGARDTSLISSTNYWSTAQSDDWTVFVGAWLFACVNGVFALASGCDALLRKCQLPRLHHRQHSGLPLSLLSPVAGRVVPGSLELCDRQIRFGK